MVESPIEKSGGSGSATKPLKVKEPSYVISNQFSQMEEDLPPARAGI